jgi:glutathione S-transferase
MSIKLHHSPFSRSRFVVWMAEEAGLPYELSVIDMMSRQHKGPEYLKVHPHGLLPALEDEGRPLFESAALCMYLADKAGKLAPPLGTYERGLWYQWIVWTVTTEMPPLTKVAMNTMFLPEKYRKPEVAEQGRAEWKEPARVLEAALQGKEWLVADEFSAADVMAASAAGFAQMLGLTGEYPNIEAYVARSQERPAFKRAASR